MAARLSSAAAAVLLAAVLVIPPPLCAAAQRRETMRLSLEEGIPLVLANNLDLAVERITPRLKEKALESEEGLFDVELFGSIKRLDSTRPLTTRSSVAAGGLRAIQSKSYTFSTGLTGTVPLGTTYTLEFKDNWSADTFNRFTFEYDAFAGITLTQPLLKGFGSDSTRYRIELARKALAVSENELRGRILDTLAAYITAYWDLVAAREELKVREESVRLAEALVELNRRKLDAEVASPLDVTQAEAGVAARREAVILARRDITVKENALKLMISSDIMALRDVAVLPTDSPRLLPVRYSLEENVRTALAKRPDYLARKLAIEESRIKVRYAENQLYPSVDLEASYGYNGLGTNFFDAVESFSGNPEWSIGVTVRYPLGNRVAGGELGGARLEARRALLELKRLEQRIIVAVDNALREITAAEERVRAARRSVRLAEESLRAEQEKLAAGLSTTFNVLEYQQKLTEARSAEIRALADYNKSLTLLRKERGTLMEDYDIELDGGGPAGRSGGIS